MSEMKQVRSLEIEEDLAFQRREWRVERVAWVVMVLVLAAGLLGVFGAGPLSWASVSDREGNVGVTYDRAGRYRRPTRLEVMILPQAVAASGEVRLWLDEAYLRGVEVAEVMPPPSGVSAVGDRREFTFRLSPEAGPARIIFRIEPEQVGRLRGRLGVGDGAPLEFGQFIYP